MTEKQLRARAELARIHPGTALYEAARLVLVDGLTAYAAAAQAGCTHQPVYRAVAACAAAPEAARAEIARLQKLLSAMGADTTHPKGKK